MDKHTQLIHDPRLAPIQINSLQPPVYRASTIIFDNTQALFQRHWSDRYDYSYGTHGTPTTYLLADQMARLEGGNHALLAPSGLAAIVLVNTALLGQGDEVWVTENMYSPNLEHLRELQKRYGVVIKIYDPLDAKSFQPTPACKLIWLEAAGSVTLEFPDLQGLIKIAKEHHVCIALDSTWGAGLAYSPFDLDGASVDICVHALTKYPSGGGDVLMGSIVTQDKALHKQLLRMHAVLGFSVSGDDCARVYRSLPTLALRYETQSKSAIELMAHLKDEPAFAQVLHPANPDTLGHHFWQQNCPTGLSAGLVSVVFDERYSWADVCRFCDALKIFKLGFSWGSATSLVMLYDLTKIRTLPSLHLQGRYVVRFCVGLEAPKDLIDDIKAALGSLNYDEKSK
ncbi:PLP-dependent transferase [Moraxella canis]|uniref:PLP-dependent transferase n=1 Tax=Moraxella canis TaxID=90239 RepID=A0ABZ0WVU1_9GAMM|nr:PLP-dependent transferase [Moraxella canis]WQE03170.1 PLP-dependent transferase [Moraxella canis]